MLKYVISFTLLPLSAFSQEMGANILSYKDAEQSFNQKIVDWSEVRGELNFRKWCDDKKEYFYAEIDVNSDKVVNKRDVSTINQDEAKIYASELTNTLFTFWAPDLNEHLEKTTASLNKPFFEEDIISLNQASNHYNAIVAALKLDTLSAHQLYVKAISTPEQVQVLSEGYTAEGNKWIKVSVPFTMNFYINNDTEQTDRTLQYILIKKIKSHPDDSDLAPISVGITL